MLSLHTSATLSSLWLPRQASECITALYIINVQSYWNDNLKLFGEDEEQLVKSSRKAGEEKKKTSGKGWVLCFIFPGCSQPQIVPFTLQMTALHQQTEQTHEHHVTWQTAGPGFALWTGVKCASGRLLCEGRSHTVTPHSGFHRKNIQTHFNQSTALKMDKTDTRHLK